jgi:transcriptional regulator with XRE-family HTH domain/Zn-dependent peptidase ImmA (M78 family)
MDRSLNRPAISQAMQAQGLSQSSIAEALGVTRAAVSKWMTGQSFPRPAELLKLGKLFNLGYAQLVEAAPASPNEPLVAFRRRAGTKTTPEHVAHARQMGRLLNPVVKHLSFDRFLSPSRLKNPSLDYDYVQALVVELRKELGLDAVRPIDFPALIGKFSDFQTVIVPVMWGKKDRHENALHVFLPESKTTWVYLNLDSHIHDFKFWMAHELGHVLAVDLLTEGKNDEAEDFSDAFAGALLFSEAAAEKVYVEYSTARLAGMRMEILVRAATSFVISPNSVYKEIQKFAKARCANTPFASVPDKVLHPTIARFNKRYPCVSETLFGAEKPTAERFVNVCAETFETPVFAALASYLQEQPQSDMLVSRILDVPLTDAKELRRVLTPRSSLQRG